MAQVSKQKACLACTESKRRCDRALPSCSRCDDRDVDCQYPATKRRRRRQEHPRAPSDRPSQQSGLAPTADAPILDDGPLTPGTWSLPWADLDSIAALPPAADFTTAQPRPAGNPQEQPSSQTCKSQHSTNPAVVSIAESRWFLSPSTWRIVHWPAPAQDSYPIAAMANFNRGLQAWVRRWVMEGHSPFMHRSLYAEGSHFPSCIQDAFTSASAYYHKSPQNEAFVYRIIDNRVEALIASQPVGSDNSLSVPLLETRDHLARVHALYVYTVIRLFDGSVSQRAAAESHLLTLHLWSKQLWESATMDANTLLWDRMPDHSKYCLNSPSLPASREVIPAAAEDGGHGAHRDTYQSDLMTWSLWVLSESIRRIWILVSCTTGVYDALKGRWGNCAGSALFTARAGLWDAASAPRWAALRRQVVARQNGGNDGDRVLFMSLVHGEELFRNTGAAEVDEFSRHLLTCISGLDRIEDWALRTAPRGEINLVY